MLPGKILDLKIPRRTRDFVPLTTAGIVLAAIYGIVYIVFLIQVVMQAEFAHGYLRPDLLPGPFTSDRYSIEWFILMASIANVFVIVSFAWMFYDPVRAIRRQVHLYMTSLLLGADIIALLVLLVISCFFCNSPLNAGSLCNDSPEKYCLVYANTFPDRCAPLPVNTTAASPNTLITNTVFSWLGIWLLVMTILNALTLIINGALAQTAKRYDYRTLGAGRVQI